MPAKSLHQRRAYSFADLTILLLWVGTTGCNLTTVPPTHPPYGAPIIVGERFDDLGNDSIYILQ